MSNTFENKVTLMTGAASGIGRAVAQELGRRGAVLVLTDIDEKLLDETAAGIEQAGGRAEAARLDVTDAEAVRNVITDAARRHGRLDYLFNNAGIAIQGEIRDFTLEHWQRTLDVNLRGVINGVHAAYPLMIEQGFGHIVNTASVAGLAPAAGLAPYAASKHAVVGISTTLRAEGMSLGVRCSAVCPGIIQTPIMQNMTILNEEQIPGGRQTMFDTMGIRPYPVERCAQKIVRGVERNKAIIVVAPLAWFLWTVYRISPGLAVKLMALGTDRSRRQLPIKREVAGRS